MWKGSADVNPKILRQHARDCDRMATECPDLFTKDALRELAVEFMRAADALDRSPRTKLHGHRLRRDSTRRMPTHQQEAQGGKRRRASSSAR
jgi:hypothetical protein